jgi:hypothetical protein
MAKEEGSYYSMEFVEENGKLYVAFYNKDGKLMAKREISQRIEINIPNIYKN